MLADDERLCAPLLVAREVAKHCTGGLLLRRLCDDGWPMSTAVGAAVRRAWRDVSRDCRAIFHVAPPPAGHRSGDVVTADFF
ncbi:glutamate receptor 2.9-like [Dorcoceras hygrometricum]|uniref:Glutamate receptor 2.9-like n=1 Tax=Dorcoceras hygrometricum TaxID=472368 RepID=A0A2Z6ZUF7_9LAMI|nr:glutamate receptor 2.9-like [Dorcoceras hygrometricum]